jgi:hypothetical protein
MPAMIDRIRPISPDLAERDNLWQAVGLWWRDGVTLWGDTLVG